MNSGYLAPEKFTRMKKLYAGKLLQPLMAAVVFLVLSVMYFLPQIQGKVLQPSDIISVRAASQELTSWKEKTGETVLWTNSMFSGMPTYQISLAQANNLMNVVQDFLQGFIARPIGYFLAAMLCVYIVLLCLGAGHWPSMVGAVAFGLTTNQISLYEAGHMTKFMTIVYSAYVVGGVILAYQKKYLLGGILFAVGMGLSLLANHVQMTYYFGIYLIIYVLLTFIYSIKNKEIPSFLKASGFLIIGLILALGSSASKLWTTIQYTEDTMRGKPVLEQPLMKQSSGPVEGLNWDYAMQWSNGAKDILAMLIPRAAGGSGAEYLSANSATMKELRARGVRQEIGLPLYFGSLPFTAGPSYMGAAVLFLFVFGLFYIKPQIRWWLLGVVVFSLLLSMGKHFSILNRPLFDLFPLFSKFRAPSSILSTTALLIPIGAALGLGGFMRGHEKSFTKPLWIALGVVGGITLLVALFGGWIFSFNGPGDARLVEAGFNIDALIADRKSALSADAWRSLIMILLSAGVIYVYHQEKIKQWLLISGLGLIIIADLWAVGRRYINSEDFVEERQVNSVYEPRAVDKQILQDPDLYYRVHDLTTNPFQSAIASYHHKTIGGYSAVKMQRYQDMIDRYLAKGHMNIFSMLNTKYFIINDAEGNEVVRPNPDALGNVWFIETIKMVDSNIDELNALDSLDLRANVVIHREFESQVKGFDPVKYGTIELTSYSPNELVYKSSSPADGIAVFSDIYFGPDKGWQAYIDGVKAPHMRANFILRAMNVPKGDHEIRFKFEPVAFYAGEKISLAFSILLLLALLFGLYKWLTKAEPIPPFAFADMQSSGDKVRKRKPGKK